MSETDYERLAYQVHEAGRQDYPKPWCQRAAAAVLEAWAEGWEKALREENDLLKRQRNLLGERVARLSVDVNNLKETVDWMMK